VIDLFDDMFAAAQDSTTASVMTLYRRAGVHVRHSAPAAYRPLFGSRRVRLCFDGNALDSAGPVSQACRRVSAWFNLWDGPAGTWSLFSRDRPGARIILSRMFKSTCKNCACALWQGARTLVLTVYYIETPMCDLYRLLCPRPRQD
jgi:hypothetical protein